MNNTPDRRVPIEWRKPSRTWTSEPHPTLGGMSHRCTFPNKRGASIVRHRGSYGFDQGLWELAVLSTAGNLDYTTPITDDVLGRLTEAQVAEVLRQIEALP